MTVVVHGDNSFLSFRFADVFFFGKLGNVLFQMYHNELKSCVVQHILSLGK